jgi:hypothetical protein
MKRISLFILIVAVFATSVPSIAESATPKHSVTGEDVAHQEIRSGDNRPLVIRPERVTPSAGVVYQLPAPMIVPSAELVVAARIHGVTVVRETITLPATLPDAVFIAFLSNHRAVLEKLRQRSAKTALRFTISIDDRVVVDIPFSEALRVSNPSVDRVVVGLSRSVDVRIPGLERSSTAKVAH